MNSSLRTTICAVLLAIGLTACSMTTDWQSHECKSIENVKANIDTLDGTEVSVCGYLKYEFEDKNLYASPKSARRYSEKQCLSVGSREGASIDTSLTGHWVRITGVAAANFCPVDTICSSSCSKNGVFAKEIKRLR